MKPLLHHQSPTPALAMAHAHWHRRRLLQLGWGLGLGLGSGLLSVKATATQAASTVLQPRTLVFPQDGGAHPDFRTEWWYLTGWAQDAQGVLRYGFQITFFRSRVDAAQGLRSALAARQLLMGHAAVTDVAAGKLWHAQRMARWSGADPALPTDAAHASHSRTAVQLQGWLLQAQGQELRAGVQAEDFALDLRLAPTQPLLLQGDRGLSRKGPSPEQASYYYSQPHLQARGTLRLQGQTLTLASGSTAWLDHEWSNELLAGSAVGWDWMGINLFDGSALTAFRLRDRNGQAVWDGGSLRNASGLRVLRRGELRMEPLRIWQSPQSGARYPLEWQLQTPAGRFTVHALVDAQELDARASTGTIYWEGLCELRDSHQQAVGRGYLELTGYHTDLKI
jgi:predicted secreted hydrolase